MFKSSYIVISSVYWYTYKSLYVCVRVCACVRVVHVCLHAYVRVYVFVCACVRVCVRLARMRVCVLECLSLCFLWVCPIVLLYMYRDTSVYSSNGTFLESSCMCACNGACVGVAMHFVSLDACIILIT